MDGNADENPRGTGPAAAPDGHDGESPIALATDGAYLELMRRAIAEPRRFSFKWRGVDFAARLDEHNGGLRLTLHSDLAALPYSAEDAGERADLLAVVDTYPTGSEGKIRVVCGQKVVIEDSIDLTQTIDSTVNSIITSLTVLVLRLAPCLDLLAERASINRERRAAASS